MPRMGTFAVQSGLDFFGRSMTTESSADTSGMSPSYRIPGASRIMRTSVPSRPLVISVSTPFRRMSARSADPVPIIADENPEEIDSTDTNTITTPAIPMIATMEDPSRDGMVCRFISVTAIVCLSQVITFLRPSQRVGNLKTHRTHSRHDAGYQSHQQHQDDSSSDVRL